MDAHQARRTKNNLICLSLRPKYKSWNLWKKMMKNQSKKWIEWVARVRKRLGEKKWFTSGLPNGRLPTFTVHNKCSMATDHNKCPTATNHNKCPMATNHNHCIVGVGYVSNTWHLALFLTSLGLNLFLPFLLVQI